MTLTRQNYVKEAEEVVNKLKKKRKRDGTEEFLLTTSKIRNLLSMISEIYNDTLHNTGEKLSEDCQERLQYLKMRFAYEAVYNQWTEYAGKVSGEHWRKGAEVRGEHREQTVGMRIGGSCKRTSPYLFLCGHVDI